MRARLFFWKFISIGSGLFAVALALLHLFALLTADKALEPGFAIAAGSAFVVAFATYIIFTAVSSVFLGWWGGSAAALVLGLYFACASITASVPALRDATLGGSAPPLDWLVVISGLAGGVGCAAIARFSQLFVTELTPSRIQAAWRDVGRARAVAALLSTLVHPAVIWSAGLLLGVLLATRALLLTPALAAVVIFVDALFILLNLWTSHRLADAAGKRQIVWIVEGLVLGAVLVALDVSLMALHLVTGLELPIPGWDSWLLVLGIFAGGAFLMVAVVYRGAVDPGLVVRRTVLYGALGPLLVLFFAGIENLVAGILSKWLGASVKLGPWIAAGAAALAFGPLSDYLKRKIPTNRRPEQERS